MSPSVQVIGGPISKEREASILVATHQQTLMLLTTDQPVPWTKSSWHSPWESAHYRLVAEVEASAHSRPPQRPPPLGTFSPWRWKILYWRMPLIWGASGQRMLVSALVCGPGCLAQRKGWWPPWRGAWASMKYRVIVNYYLLLEITIHPVNSLGCRQ